MPFPSVAGVLKVWKRRIRDSGTGCLYRSPPSFQRAYGAVQRGLLRNPVPRASLNARPHLEAHPEEGRWLPVLESLRSGYADPITLPEDRAAFAAFRGPVFRDIGVAELRQAEIIGQHAIPYTRRGVLLHDLSFFEKQPPAEAYALVQPVRWHDLPGRTLSLGTPYACINYTHSLVDCLPRLDLARRAGLEPRDFDWVVLPRIPFDALREALLAALRVPDERIRWADTGVGLRCELLLQTSHPCGDQAPAYPPRIVEALPPGIAVTHTPAPGRRVYLARGPGRRHLRNEAEVAAVCAEFGFETVHSSSLKDSGDFVRLFAGCAAVISPHGAGLTNVIFMPPGGTVVELAPSDWRRPYYYTLAQGNGQRYAGLMGAAERWLRAEQDFTASFTIDLGKLRRLLGALFPSSV